MKHIDEGLVEELKTGKQDVENKTRTICTINTLPCPNFPTTTNVSQIVFPTVVLNVLAFTGMPRKQLAAEKGPSNGRWDELFRTLVGLKAKTSLASSTIVTIVLIEAVEKGVHTGVVPIVFDSKKLVEVEAVKELAFIEKFTIWAMQATVCKTVSLALEAALANIFPSDWKPINAGVSVFVSPDDEIARSLPMATLVGVPSSPTNPLDLCIKIFGSPIPWCYDLEVKRIPQLAAFFQKRWTNTTVSLVHLGTTRLRASQCVLCEDGVVEKQDLSLGSGRRRHPIPRIAFNLNCGAQTLSSVAHMAHFFLVEVMWFEQRRDTPRHHVSFTWLDINATNKQLREASLSALSFEQIRSDAKLRKERKLQGVGAAATTVSYLQVWETLLKNDIVESINQSIVYSCNLDCSTIALLENNTARILQWELKWVASV